MEERIDSATTPTDRPPAKPGRFIYNRWLPLALVALALVLVLQRVVLHRSFLGPEATVRRQLDALRRADFSEARSYAAEGIKQIFDVSQFREMIRQQFPEFVASQKVEFHRRDVGENRASFEITVTGEDGGALRAIYLLSLESGTWRVTAVQPLSTPNRRSTPRATT